jgi:hypothetical protein
VTRLVSIALALFLVIAACSRDDRYDIVLAFDPPELERSASVTEVFTLRNCGAARDTGAPPPDQTLALASIVAGRSTPALGNAAPGTVAIFARARTADCQLLATGCREVNVEAGGQGEIRVTLSAPHDKKSGCSNEEICDGAGTCESGADGGLVVDGGLTGFPTASTTGVPSGTTLTPSTPQSISTDGTVLEHVDVPGCIVVKANNVTIKNSRIHGDCAAVIDNQGSGLVVEDTEIDGNDSTEATGIRGASFRCTRCNIHSVRLGMAIGGAVTLEDSYVHDLSPKRDSEADVFFTAGSTVVVRHNTLENANDGSCFSLNSTDGVIDDVHVENNLLNGGTYAVYTYSGAYPATRVVLVRNHFGRKFFPNCGSTGPVVIDKVDTSAWADNVWDDDGQPVSP